MMDATRKSLLLAGVGVLGVYLLRMPQALTAPEANDSVSVQSASQPRPVRDSGVHLTVVVDCSGSMAGHARLERVRVAIEELAGALGPQDTLGIVGFADRAEVLRGRSPISEPFTLQPGYFDGGRPGGTNLFAGLDTALDVTVGSDLGSHYVLIVSDGDANVGPVDFGSFQALIDRAELAGVQLAQFDLGGEMRSSHLETYLRHTGRYYELEAQASLGGALREALHPMQPTERSPRRAGLLRKTLGESQQFSAEVTQMQLEVAHGTFAR